MPDPMHIETTPKRAALPRRRISCSRVAVARAPVAPSGWPMAMAPPLGFTLLSSMPSLATEYDACDAKASLISNTSMSSMLSPACATAAGMAATGPTPMIAGSTPTAAKERKMPRIGRPRRMASRLVISSVAAAPSVTWLLLPAVVVPSLRKTALSAPRLSTEASWRMPSSWEITTLVSAPVLGSTTLVRTGTISSLNLPAACAAAAFLCDLTANSSWPLRVSPNLAATFSLVTPMGSMQPCALGNSPMRALMPPSHAMGLELMVSTPPARPMV
mmetsp:Transcript_33482/g.84841  ORF Transcript_33482/g.84841 Transcript_33482/m.84841 type:complete len:274 (-) Transcript_33482:550-1371(-)